MKKISIVLALLMVAILLLTGCSSQPTETSASIETGSSSEVATASNQNTETAGPAPTVKIGFMNYSDEQEFNITVGESLVAAGKAEGIEVLYQVTGQDVTTIRSVFDSFVQQGCNVIVDFTVMPESGKNLADICAEKGIYYIGVDTDAGENAYFYGLDNSMAGDILGRGVVDYIHNKLDDKVDQVVVICATIIGEEVYKRTENAVEAILADVPGITRDQVHYIDLVEFDLTKVKQQILDYLTTCSKDETIVMMSFASGFNSCAYSASTTAGMDENIHYFACDGLSEVVQMFKDGKKTINKGEVCSFPTRYGPGILDLAKRLVAGEECDRFNFVQNDFVTPDNVFELFPD